MPQFQQRIVTDQHIIETKPFHNELFFMNLLNRQQHILEHNKRILLIKMPHLKHNLF